MYMQQPWAKRTFGGEVAEMICDFLFAIQLEC